MDELIRELKLEGVLKSPYVEAAFRAIDRRDFVRPEFLSEAYGNYPLPIGQGQTISQPYTVAFMLDLLDPRPGERILDIGSGSGWTTALLVHCVSQKSGIKNLGKVLALERIPELCRFGKENVKKYNFVKKGIAKFFCRDGTAGLPEEAPFDKILASAMAMDEIPKAWRKQLKTGGKIVAPVGSSVWCFTKKSGDQLEKTEYPGFAFVPLVSGKGYREQGLGDREQVLRDGGGGIKTILAWLGLIAGMALVYAVYAIYRPVNLNDQRVNLEIQKGQGSRAISRKLYEHGLIRSPWVFITYATLLGKNNLFKPGIYEFGPRVSMPEIAAKLVSGTTNEITITIPEGWNLRDIGFYFENLGKFQAEELWEIAGFPAADYRKAGDLPPPPDFSKKFDFLRDKPEYAGLEGYLYPDTYRIFRDADIKGVIEKMLKNFDQKLTPSLRQEIRDQGKTIFEVLTMASLLESEVQSIKDRRLVAGILWKRLKAGMPLQVDATVNYITGKHETPSGDDLKIRSPYNTYVFPGLPLGPIANPSIESIRASLESSPSPYLYYLSVPDGEGRTIYSQTLEEHTQAKAKYLK